MLVLFVYLVISFRLTQTSFLIVQHEVISSDRMKEPEGAESGGVVGLVINTAPEGYNLGRQV